MHDMFGAWVGLCQRKGDPMTATLRSAFHNEPSLDFGDEANRSAMREALACVKAQLGQHYPLIIGGERRETGNWITSINPGNLDQVVGEVAKAGKADVEDA